MADPDLSRRIVYDAAGMTDVDTLRRIVYKREDDTDLLMDLYRPRGGGPGLRRPAIIFVHGGPIPKSMLPPREGRAGPSGTVPDLRRAGRAGRSAREQLDRRVRRRGIVGQCAAGSHEPLDRTPRVRRARQRRAEPRDHRPGTRICSDPPVRVRTPGAYPRSATGGPGIDGERAGRCLCPSV